MKTKIVTIENQDTFKTLKECGDIIVSENAIAEFHVLTTSGNIYLRENAKAEFPVLTTSGNIYLRENAIAEFPVLTTSGYIDLSENAKAEFHVLTTLGNIYLSENAIAEFHVLTTSGNIYLSENAKAEFPVLTTSGNIDLRENAIAEFPVLTTSGYIDLSENAIAEFHVLTTSGNIYLSENAKAEFPVLTTSGYIDLSENAKFNHYKTKDVNYKSVDNSMFVIVSTKDTKGIKIHTGYNVQKIENGKIVKQDCYVAEKDSFYAHGETAKKAIGDLQFKIVSEKLKNEPILEDTELTVSHYRAITGACELGCKNFMEQNGIPFKVEGGKLIEIKPIKAKDLLPILDRNNAYGIERFKSLIQF